MQNTLLLYCSRHTKRLQYALEELFERRMGLSVQSVQNLDSFLSYDGMKLNYSHQSIDGIPSIKPAGLLEAKRIADPEFETREAEQAVLIFADQSDLGFDALSAVFYMLSRYEEYLPFRHDEHGRFHSKSSILDQHNAILEPWVDIYAMMVSRWLERQGYVLPETPDFQALNISVDVDQLYVYRARGIARSLLGGMKDAVRSPGMLGKRIEVIVGHSHDPIDVYDDVVQRCADIGHRPTFFFQVGETSQYDLNNPVHLPQVIQKINELAIDADVGLHPSYYSSEQPILLEKEFERLRHVMSAKVDRSRQHYLRLRLPSTYRALEDLGISHEYSMGFPDVNGFRAGTCKPFRFYDLESDEITALTLHPLVFMDVISVRSQGSLGRSIEEAAHIYQVCRKVKGTFYNVWHPEVLAGLNDVPYPSMEIFESVIKQEEDAKA